MTIDNKTAAVALAAIEDAEGRLTPDAVVKAAADPNHPLHSAFEWDDAKAGRAYRIEQARELIASVRLEVTSTEIRRIAYVRDPEAEPGKQGYRATTVLADEREQARAAVRAEMGRVISCLRRAFDVAEAVGLGTGIGRLIVEAEALLDSIEFSEKAPPIVPKPTRKRSRQVEASL